MTRPLVLVYWSGCENASEVSLLRASVAVVGRSVTLYEENHPVADYNTPRVHRQFLERLRELMPRTCKPIIVSDAGFLGPWFEAVLEQGWNFVGRVRGNTQLCFGGEENGLPVSQLHARATRTPQALGVALCAKSRPYRANVYCVDESERSSRGAARSHGYGEPWILVTSLDPRTVTATQVVNLYRKRMSIELTFRDLKDDRWSMAFVNARIGTTERRAVLLLIAALATLIQWLTGLVGRAAGWHRNFQANTVRVGHVLSVVFLGRELLRNARYVVTDEMAKTALQALRLKTVTSFDVAR